MIFEQLRLLACLKSGHILCLFPEKQTHVVSYFCLVSTTGWTKSANFLSPLINLLLFSGEEMLILSHRNYEGGIPLVIFLKLYFKEDAY